MGDSRQDGRSTSRERLVASALRLLQRQGYSGTGVSEIARAGEAPMGSFYHYFPGGKEQLAAAAMETGAQAFDALIAQALHSSADVADCLAAIALDTARVLQSSDWERGCPVATTALETVFGSAQLQAVAREAFERWTGLVRDRLIEAGHGTADATELATTVLAMIEGAELLARVQRSTEPLQIVAKSMHRLASLPHEPASAGPGAPPRPV